MGETRKYLNLEGLKMYDNQNRHNINKKLLRTKNHTRRYVVGRSIPLFRYIHQDDDLMFTNDASLNFTSYISSKGIIRTKNINDIDEARKILDTISIYIYNAINDLTHDSHPNLSKQSNSDIEDYSKYTIKSDKLIDSLEEFRLIDQSNLYLFTVDISRRCIFINFVPDFCETSAKDIYIVNGQKYSLSVANLLNLNSKVYRYKYKRHHNSNKAQNKGKNSKWSTYITETGIRHGYMKIYGIKRGIISHIPVFFTNFAKRARDGQRVYNYGDLNSRK